jgi:hypothetical protein
MKKVVNYYNNAMGFDYWKVCSINIKTGIITLERVVYEDEPFVRSRNVQALKTIGFYEWLFNPIYKVFEVFNICWIDDMDNIAIVDPFESSKLKQPQEILEYLKRQVKK